jgi:hypothetical protein
MDCTQLDSLLKITKKSEASKENKDKFFTDLSALLSETGYSAVFEKYLFEGFSFCGARPMFSYLNTLDISGRFSFVNNIIKGGKYRTNEKFISLQLLIHLLAHFIVTYPQEKDSIGILIFCIPGKSKTKTGSICNKLPIILDKYFIKELTLNIVFPDLTSILVDQDIKIEFCALFSNAVKEIKDEDPSFGNAILSWLSANSQESIPQADIQVTDNVEKAILNTDSIPSDKNLKIIIASLAEALKKLSSFSEYHASLESKLVESKRRISVLSGDLLCMENSKNKSEKGSEDLKKLTEVLEAENRKMKSECMSLKSSLLDKETLITTLTAESLKQKSVLSTYSHDKQNSLNEQLNVIARKLTSFYLNYKDSMEMKMTPELGNNIRSLMGDIFKTLQKSGINAGGND